MQIKLIDRKFRSPRIWSNGVLKPICNLLGGHVVNVSGWKDSDKDGLTYRSYFPKATKYSITNYKSEACGFQGNLENEIFLDLEASLPPELRQAFDVVFSHTVLEHVFECVVAAQNMADMTRDALVITVPFLQEQHTDYGDYWRFTPTCLARLLRKTGLQPVYIDYNDAARDSIYVVAVATRYPERWSSIRSLPGNKLDTIESTNVGKQIIRGKWLRIGGARSTEDHGG